MGAGHGYLLVQEVQMANLGVCRTSLHTKNCPQGPVGCVLKNSAVFPSTHLFSSSHKCGDQHFISSFRVCSVPIHFIVCV